MISVTTADFLTAWEHGLSQSSSRRLVTLLATVHAEMSEEQILKLPIGQRDDLALSLRELLFGSQLTSLAVCPLCSERLELELDINDIRVGATPTQKPLLLKSNDFELAFRLPDSQDLLVIEATGSIENARRILLERCLLSASHNGQTCTVRDLSEEILEKVETTMAEADPQAEIQLDLSCPACQHNWFAVFDIASFLWSEVNAWAQRVLNEVHLLAKAYSWREADILAIESNAAAALSGEGDVMSQYLSHLAALTLNKVQPLQPRLASRFETPVDRGVPDSHDIPVVEESPVSPSVPTQSSPIAATNSPSPVTQKVMTAFSDGHTKQEPSKQDQFTVGHTEFVIKSPDPKNEQKPTLTQRFTPVDTEPVNRTAPSIIQPVTQPSDTISDKNTPPKENTHAS